MNDVKCPYCEHKQEINHDDGYGYEEGEKHEQYCENCDRKFNFTTSILYCYEVFCDGEHDIEETEYKGRTWYECTKCDYSELRRPEVSE